MSELDDHQLLAEFARTHSEAAFAVLVQRHVNLVYSVALRSVGNAHAAQEISQAVFLILAQKAKNLSPKIILSGWLYQTTRLTAANFLRGEIRRQQRESEAYMQSTLNEPEVIVWPQIAPLLDAALAKLGERDRNAIVLRFFENKNLREVGAALGASEDAAKMRVNRALEKLRKFFTKRGVALSAVAIAGAVSANSVQAAPAGLAVTITAVAKGATVSGSTLTLIKGALKIMAWTKMKTVLVVGVGALLAAGTATTIIIEQKHRSATTQIHIKARFFEISKSADDFSESLSGILDAGPTQTLLQKLKSKHGVVLSEPEIVTSTGRQSQMRATQVTTVITNGSYSAGGINIQSTKMEFGSVIDVVPRILQGGKIQVSTTVSVAHFYGYADGSKLAPDYATNSGGDRIALPIFLPAIQIKKASTAAALSDGQTLLMILAKAEPPQFSTVNSERQESVARHIAAVEKRDGEKTTLALITFDLVDSAGNPVKQR